MEKFRQPKTMLNDVRPYHPSHMGQWYSGSTKHLSFGQLSLPTSLPQLSHFFFDGNASIFAVSRPRMSYEDFASLSTISSGERRRTFSDPSGASALIG